MLYKCSGTHEMVHRAAGRTPKRFIKYCTSEYCYDVGVQILFYMYSNRCYPDTPLYARLLSRLLARFYWIDFGEPSKIRREAKKC